MENFLLKLSKTVKLKVKIMSDSDVVNSIGASASSYLENYKILQETAQYLREQEAVDVDMLIPLVDKALSAYAVCKSRIEAVEKMLAERLGGSDEVS